MSSRRGAALALGAAVLACPSAAGAAGAVTNTYEQITRATGPQGQSKMETAWRPDPTWVSDGGIVASWTESQSVYNFGFGPQSTLFRNTWSDKTRSLGPNVGKLYAVDKTEKIGLFRRFTGTQQAPAFTYAVGTIDGGGLVDVPGVEDGSVPPQLSGNGRYVVTSGSQGLRRFDVTTRAWTTIAPLGYINSYSVSDDGQSIASIDFDQAAQRVDAVVWKNGQRKLLVQGYDYRGPGTDVMISPDGSTAFTVASPEGARSKLTAHKLSGGPAKTTEIPYDTPWSQRPLWISPSGDQIAWALNSQSPDLSPVVPAQVWKVGGAWKPFGGAFATSLKTDDGIFSPPSKVSRNGAYAAIALNDQIALVSLNGTPLAGNPGGKQGLSASAYVAAPGVDYCGTGFSPTFSGSFIRPALFLPMPKKARVTVANGPTVLADAEWTKPAPFLYANGDYDNLFVNFPTTATRKYTFKVTDGNGRVLFETFTQNVTCTPPTS